MKKLVFFALKSAIALLGISAVGIYGLFLLWAYPELRFWQRHKREYSLNGSLCRHVEDKYQSFHEESNLIIPENVEILTHCNDRGGFHWDGEYYAAFRFQDAQYLNSLLENNSWDIPWQQGLIPEEPWSNSSLSKQFANSTDYWYVIEGGEDYFNHLLLVVDLRNNLLFYSKFDR